MIETEFNSQTVFLLNDEPDWTVLPEAELSMFRDRQAGLTHREARRPYAATFLIKFNYNSTVRRERVMDLQAALRSLDTEPVICPFWPAITYWQDRAAMKITGGLMIAWKAEWSQFELYTGAEPGWPADGDFVAPALAGFLLTKPSKVLTFSDWSWEVQFVESSDVTNVLVPAAVAWTAGPTPAGYAAAPMLLPFRPDHGTISEEVSVEVRRDQQGFGREQYQTFYQHEAERSQDCALTLVNDDIWKFVRFFSEIAAPGAPFWASAALQVCSLTDDAVAGDTVLDVDTTAGLLVGDYLSIFSGLTQICRKITAKSSNTITVNAAVGVALTAGVAHVFLLCLSRLDKPVTKLTWSRPGVAVARLSWTQLPTEELVPADEVVGDSIGRLPTRAILFHFQRDLGNGTILDYRYTSFEQDLQWGPQNFLARGKFACGEITQSLNLENDGCDISCFKFDGNPLVEDLTKRAEAPLTVKIYFADIGEPVSMMTEGGGAQMLSESGQPMLSERP